jgi:lactoylglutathione lyase
MTSWVRQFCIYVKDLDRTIKFYETLGLSCTSRTKITDHITEAMLENPDKGGWIQLAQNTAHEGPIDMGTSVWKLYIYTDDCQGLYDKAMAAGYKSVSKPSRLDRWPVTMAYIEDPDGYVIELIERHEPAAAGGAGGSARDQNV